MYCKKCGATIDDAAILCPHCGCATQSADAEGGLTMATKIFMIIGCIASAWFFLIPLCWTIPMTVHYFRATETLRPIGTGFKVCSLLFVNTIAGILMLCDKKN